MKYFFSILILTIASVDVTAQNDALQRDKTLSKIFDREEINDLEKILAFFEHQICVVVSSSNEVGKGCHTQYLERLDSLSKMGMMAIDIPFSAQQALYNEIESSTFDQIWEFGEGTKPGKPNDLLKSITFNKTGKYLKLLKLLGKRNAHAEVYYEAYKATGTISPLMVATILRKYDEIDLSDVKFRLLIAVHYLTLNDQYLRVEKF